MKTMTVYALDPGFRHGALLGASFIQSPRPRLLSVVPLFVWTERTSRGLKVDSSPLQTFKFMEEILTSITGFTPGFVVMDFDPKSVYWRPLKLQVVQLGLMVGYLCHGLYSRGFSTTFITPREIRSFVGLKANAKKPDIHKWLDDELGPEVTTLQNFQAVRNNSDLFDALALAYIFAMLYGKAANHDRTTSDSSETRLPGS